MHYWNISSSPSIGNRSFRAPELMPPDLWQPKLPYSAMYRSKSRVRRGKMQWTRQVGAANGSDEAHSILSALRSYIVLANLFGLLPVQDSLNNDPTKLHFRWFSAKTSYTLAVVTVFLLMTIHRAYLMICHVSIFAFDQLATTACPLWWSVFAVRQAHLFPTLIREWTKVERQMMSFGTVPHLKKHLDVIVYGKLSLTMVIIVGYQLVKYDYASHCSGDFAARVQLVLVYTYYSVFRSSDTAMWWKTPVAFVVQLHLRCTWMFAELTFIVLSYSLYHRFKLFNNHLEQYREQNMSPSFWLQMRLTYNSLSRLTKMLDTFLSLSTCLIFGINVFFICFVLLKTFTVPLANKGLYFILVYSVFRTIFMSLIASYINDLSRQPLSVLNEVPSESFCSEVLRFQMEVIADDVTLTGCHFFSITRSFMLTIAGTIATYEVVLLQFHALRMPAVNYTVFCSELAFLNINSVNSSFSEKYYQ